MWTDLNINFEKQCFQHCCKQSNQYISIDEIDNLGKDVFDFHEENVKNRKISIDDNKLPPACKWCIDTAPDNIKNVWNLWSDDFIEHSKDWIKKTSKTYYIDFDIGKSCDLACVYCGPWSSTTWSKELGKPVLENKSSEWKEKILHNIGLYLRDMDSNRHITFNILGGEPLIMTETYDIIEYLGSHCSHFKNKPSMMITTNLNCKPKLLKKLLDTIEKTKDVFQWIISVSIEDVYDRAEAVRYHLDFNRFEKNLLSIKDKVDKIHVTTTLSILSFPNFSEFLVWIFGVLGKQEYCKHWTFSLNHVQYGFTSISYIPKALINIEEIKNTYIDLVENEEILNNFHSESFLSHMDNTYQLSGTTEPDQKFFNWWKVLSERRNINYFSFYPLSELIDD